MIPIRDDNPRRYFPFITLLIIIANIAVQIYQWKLGSEAARALIYRLGAIPWEIVHFQELPDLPIAYQSGFPNVVTLITSLFLHGGFFHLAGNMLYLWIFGDNVESIMGHFRFLVFYLCCGVIATMTHVFIDPSATIPMIGASGAISGVLAAYLVRFPHAKVHILIIFFFFIRVVKVSAVFVLGFWFLVQILNGLGTLGVRGGGVAWFAHIGGFAAGLVLVFLFTKKKRIQIHRI